MNVLDIAKKIVHEGPICDHCMGRQFAKLSTGLTNDKRGSAIKLALAMEGDRINKDEGDKEILEDLSTSSVNARKSLRLKGEDEKCWVCLGLFEKLDTWAERAENALKEYEHSTFLVGTKMSGLLSENEEIIWTESGTTYAEQFKSEMNREVGKLIAQRTGKEVDLENPDILVTLDLAEEKVHLQVRSVYILGRYRKMVRTIPQTRWPCRACRGRGCEICNFTGKQYPESVDELIKDPVVEALKSKDTKFHGAGREDIDALMLGTGRPFVVEAVEPMLRTCDLAKVEKEINERAGGKIEVEGLTFTPKSTVENLKTVKADKVYKLKVTFKEQIPEDKLRSTINDLIGAQIQQRTPQRVSHRRADLVRKRTVHDMKLNELADDYAMIEVHCEGGLYVKELISSDEGRTIPSLTGLLGSQAFVTELDVVGVDI